MSGSSRRSFEHLAAAPAIAFSASFLLCGYEFVRSAAQSLFIQAYGAQALPVAMALAPAGTLAMIAGYGLLLSRSGPRRAIVYTSMFSAACLVVCQAAIAGGFRPAAGFLYVFREAYIVLLVEQIWSFINSTFRTGEGRRWNGPICGIASLGAISGGLLVRAFAGRYGSPNLLLLAAVTMFPSGLLAAWAYRAGGEPQPAESEARGRQGHLGWRTLAGQRGLICLALLVATTQIVAALADLQLSRFVEIALPDVDRRTAWFGGFYAALNGGAAVLQFVVSPLLLYYGSPRLAQLAIPLVHLGLCALCLVHPSLASAAALYYGFKALDYSVFRASKELVYIPLSFDARYRAKQLVDAFVYRFAKGGASAVVATAGFLGSLPLRAYPAAAAAALVVWIPLVFGLALPGRRQRGALAPTEDKR